MFENNETDPVLTLVPDYKVSILYSGTGTYRAQILARVLNKRCVHIRAQRVSYSGTSAREPSVNAPLVC